VRRQGDGAGRLKTVMGLAAMLLVALTLAACGGDDDEGGSGDSGGSGGGGGGSESAGLDLQNEGQLTIGAEFPVEGFQELPIDDPKGFEIDFADAVAKELGVPKVQWVTAPFSGLFSPAPKRFDMAINQITITPERAKVVDFSVPYFDANQGFLIKKGGPAEGVTTIADMKDLQFGFQVTTTGGIYIEDEIQPDKQPQEFTALPPATQALANGQIDAFLMDVAIGSGIVEQRGEDIDMTGQFETNEEYGVLFEKGNPLKAEVNKAIEKLRADGTLKKLQAKWFPGTEDLPVLE
jgi:polar amino acid transport system substrate-binding protein